MDRFKAYGYNITTDPEFMNEKSGITPELQNEMDTLYHKALKGGEKNIQYLISQIEKYPAVPNLKNYLSVAYMNSGNKQKSIEVNDWILTEHPDYLFGLLNKANIYYLAGEYDKMPEVLGEAMEIKELNPDRDIFHLSEVVSFYKSAIMYFSAINNIEAAETRFQLLEELAPDHKETEIAFNALMAVRLKVGNQRFLEEEKTRITPKFSDYNKSIQTDKAPDFNHQLIHELYKNDIDINQDVLREILDLPRESLIDDLKKVLFDSICRYEHFKALDEKNNLDITKVTFPIHAIFLLGELKTHEALNNILETFRQGEDYIEFWYGDFMTDSFWLPLLYLTPNNLDILRDFMLESGVYTYAKSEVSTAVTQFYYHHPEKRNQVVNWYESIINHYLTSNQDNLIDTDLIGLIICEILEADFKELIPGIEKLYEAVYVGQGICGTLKEVKEDFGKHEMSHWKKDVLTIFDQYNYILDNWYSYNKEKHDRAFGASNRNEETYVHEEPKIGRNDPCPCGSGKKYKKCCMNK